MDSISKKDKNIQKFDKIFNTESDYLKTIPDDVFINNMDKIAERINATSTAFDIVFDEEMMNRSNRFNDSKLSQILSAALATASINKNTATPHPNFGFKDFADSLEFPTDSVAKAIDDVNTSFRINHVIEHIAKIVPIDKKVLTRAVSDTYSFIRRCSLFIYNNGRTLWRWGVILERELSQLGTLFR